MGIIKGNNLAVPLSTKQVKTYIQSENLEFTPYFAKTKKVIIQLEQGETITYNPDFNMEVGEND